MATLSDMWIHDIFQLQPHSRDMVIAVGLELQLAITFVLEVTWLHVELSTQKMNATLHLLWSTLPHNGNSLMRRTGLKSRMASRRTFKLCIAKYMSSQEQARLQPSLFLPPYIRRLFLLINPCPVRYCVPWRLCYIYQIIGLNFNKPPTKMLNNLDRTTFW